MIMYLISIAYVYIGESGFEYQVGRVIKLRIVAIMFRLLFLIASKNSKYSVAIGVTTRVFFHLQH